MTLEEWSWVAGISAIPLGIVVWLVDRKQVLHFLKSGWQWLLVLFLIVAFVAVCFRGWFNWLVCSVTLPVWVLILLIFLGVFLSVATRLLRAAFSRVSSIRIEARHFVPPQAEIARQEQTPRQKPPPVQPDPRNYTSDEIFGVKWSWKWQGHQFGNLAGPFCPNCVCRLDQELCSDPNKYNRRDFYSMPISLVCPHCSFKRDYEFDYSELTRKTMVEIERRVNSGEFKSKLQN